MTGIGELAERGDKPKRLMRKADDLLGDIDSLLAENDKLPVGGLVGQSLDGCWASVQGVSLWFGVVFDAACNRRDNLDDLFLCPEHALTLRDNGGA